MSWFVGPVLLFLAAMPAAAQCTLEIGTIADLQGTWTDLTHNRRLAKNDVLCGDSKVQRVNDAKPLVTDFLKITSRGDSKQMVKFECRTLLGCEKPLDLSNLVNEEQRKLKGSGLLESFAMWRDVGNRRDHTLSRLRQLPAPGSTILKTAVIEAGKPIPAFDVFRAEGPAGKYQLDLCTQSTDDACGKTLPHPMEFSWQPGAAGNLPLSVVSQDVRFD